MGACISQEANPELSPSRTAQINQNVVIPKVIWEVDGPGRMKKVSRVLEVGSAEDMGELAFRNPNGPSRYPTKAILTLDDDFTEEDQKWPAPGAWLDSPDIEGAKQAALKTMAMMNQNGRTNVKHVVLRVFIGADLVTSKFDVANTEPTITRLNTWSKPEQWRQMLRPMIFQGVLHILTRKYLGCTVWDEGKLRFNVGDDIYRHPTRLLVARRFGDMTTNVEAVHFKVLIPVTGGSDLKLLRNLDRTKEPGGIVAVSLLVSVAESEPWPLVGTYTKNPIMLAAVKALADLVQKWNREGRVQRCLFQVHMGADMVVNKLVGEKFEANPAALVASNNLVKEFGNLEAFYIELEEQKNHELFQSESQFQAIKRIMIERRAEDPQRYAAMLPTIALNSATGFLQMNFPSCEVSDEGEFSTTIDGQIVRIAGTRLVIAKEKGKEKHNLIAILYVVFSPNGEGWAAIEKTWLDTKEMKAADDALLELLKR